MLSFLSRVFGKSRLSKVLSTKGLSFKFLAVNAVDFVPFKLGLERSFAPSYVFMEPAGYCNLRCPFCQLTLEGENRNVRLMSLAFFKSFIEKNRRYLTHIHFGMWGEPLLNKDLPEMVRIAKEAGITVILVTNGTLLTDKKMVALAEAGLKAISISVDGLGQVYEDVREVTWEKILSKIDVALRHRAQYGYKIEVCGVEHKLEDRIEFKDFFTDLGVDLVWTQPLYYDEENKTTEFSRPCYRPWHSLAVYADGEVSMCCFDHKKEAVVGDANEKTLVEIFNGPRLRQIRRSFVNGTDIPELCQGCHPRYR